MTRDAAQKALTRDISGRAARAEKRPRGGWLGRPLRWPANTWRQTKLTYD